MSHHNFAFDTGAQNVLDGTSKMGPELCNNTYTLKSDTKETFLNPTISLDLEMGLVV